MIDRQPLNALIASFRRFGGDAEGQRTLSIICDLHYCFKSSVFGKAKAPAQIYASNLCKRLPVLGRFPPLDASLEKTSNTDLPSRLVDPTRCQTRKPHSSEAWSSQPFRISDVR
jgi:hypothetical protein